MTDKRDPYADELERQKQLEQWRAKKKHEAQEAERQEKRERLEAHLAERARVYIDHTGTTPSTSLLENWQAEYVTNQARQKEAERAARLAEAESQPHYHPHV